MAKAWQDIKDVAGGSTDLRLAAFQLAIGRVSDATNLRS